MQKLIRILFLVTPFVLVEAHAHEGCTCGGAPTVKATTSETKEAPSRHALRGVVVNVVPEQSALLVKHEEIPGVMKAMTMLLKVDAETLGAPQAKKGTAITGFLVRKTDGWWLEEVRSAD